MSGGRKIINECYETTKKIIKDNKNLLELIANSLLEHETLTKEQIDYLVKNGKMPSDEEVKEESKDLESLLLDELKILAKEKGIKGYTKMTKEELKTELEK